VPSYYVETERPDFWQLARNSQGDYLDPRGPLNCQTHTASRLVMRANEGKRPAATTGVWPPTGAAIRAYTGDNSGGVNHSQVSVVARTKYDTILSVRYGLPFDDFIDLVEETRGAGLSIWYKRIRDSPFRGSTTFYQNHEIFIGGVDRERGVFTDVVDPLADGRYPGLFKGPGNYPIALLRMAAGDLNVASQAGDYVRLGTGLCYAIVTQPTGSPPSAPVVPPSSGIRPEEKIPVNVLESRTVNALLTQPVQRVRLDAGVVVYKTLDKRYPLDKVGATPVRVPLTGYPGTGWRTVVITTSKGFTDGVKRTVEAYVDKDDAELL